MTEARSPTGLRREVLIVLPAAVLLLLFLSTFVLFSYRSAIDRLIDDRRGEALRLARSLASQLDERPETTAGELRRLLPTAQGLAVFGPQGPRLAIGDLGAIESDELLARVPAGEPTAVGPDEVAPDRVVAFAVHGSGARRETVRVDLGARALAGQRRGLRVLSVVALGIDAGLALLLLLYLRTLLAPFDLLLRRARAAGLLPAEPGPDETAALLATFERATAALARPPAADFAALEETLGRDIESGLLLIDPRGCVLAVNPAGSALLGLPAPPPGTPLAELLAPEPALARLLDRAIAEGRPIERAEVACGPPERRRTLGLALLVLRRPNGEPRGFIALFTDATELTRRAVETRLADSLAQLGELAAGVAHELRNGLATLAGYLGLAERSGGTPRAEDLVEMRREITHLQRVVDDFLAFARPGSARVETVRLAALLQQVAADPAGSREGVRLTIPAEAVAASLRGDPQLLARALTNLLRNAREAQSGQAAAPPIELALGRESGGWEIRIDDRGPGLPESVRARLFQPFVSARPGGVGLGLALAHRILALHGAQLRLEDRPGGGTTAKVLFPAVTSDTNGNAAEG